MTTAVVFNPSKATDPVKARQQICAALLAEGIADPLWFESTREDPGGGQCRQAVAQGADLVIVSGGDGTVMACAAVLAGTDVRLAVLPAGTGNLLARNFGISRELAAAAHVAAHGQSRRIDVGAAGDERFVIMAGMGFDAQMLADAPDALKAKLGWLAYLVSASRHLLESRHTFTLTLDDGQPQRFRGRGILVGNLGRLQGNLPVLPCAEPDDGLLDVAVINTHGLLSWALLATSVVLRRPDPRRLQTFQAATVLVRCSKPLACEVDGEVLDVRHELDISVLPRALTLQVPSA
jgi:YegS/Rv2252/BmrU family lipid kinase